MQKHIRITLAQLNFLLGDIVGNTEKIIASAIKARDEQQSDLIIFSELSLTGYPPEDLLLRSELYQYVRDALEKIKTTVKGITVIVGHPTQTETGRYNAASVIQDGKIIDTYHKYHLPNYSVFDEKRYFISGEKPCVFSIKNIPVGITICEDLWQPGPLKQAVDAGAKLMLCLNASPFHHNKVFQREQILQHRQQEEGKIPIVYVNCVGGQDELIFDGYSTVLDAEGKVKLRAPAYEECLLPIDFEFTKNKTIETISGFISEPLSDEASLYQALVLGTRDYIQKNHFKGALIGLSGGIDSALTLAIAVDAIGADKIHGLLMPSRYTAEMSIEDAVAEANALGVKYSILSIEKSFSAFLETLAPEFSNYSPDVTEENIQARCRGILLMSMSNKTGKIVLTTGNKSEMAVGYATLYGDMAGGFSVLKDVTKTWVYRLAKYRNTIHFVIPQRVLDRAPSAELAPNQTDQDSLPPYNILDPIMMLYVEENMAKADIIQLGYAKSDVDKVTALIDKNEYKRRQSPPGIRISHRAFGRDWRYPITSGFGKQC